MASLPSRNAAGDSTDAIVSQSQNPAQSLHAMWEKITTKLLFFSTLLFFYMVIIVLNHKVE